jgi:anti-anti-sigma regulatory factor
MVTSIFEMIGKQKPCFKITLDTNLTSNEVTSLRNIIEQNINSNYDDIFINAKDVKNVDLSGINEIINAHYVLEKASKKLHFIFTKNSEIEKWVDNTSLHKFVTIGIIPE